MNTKEKYEKMRLALEYFNGEQGEDNKEKAFSLFNEILKEDPSNKYAINNLGNCYAYGIGTAKDEARAKSLYQQAAELGDVSAQFNYAKCLEKEENAECIEWYKKASEGGDTDAPVELYNCIKTGKYGSEEMDPQIMKWIDKSAEAGNIDACEIKGIALSEEQKYSEAVTFLQIAVEAGRPKAKTYLADILLEDIDGIEKDADKAFALYKEASKSGYIPAVGHVAKCYLIGKGCEKRPDLGVFLYEKAAERGDSNSIFSLGTFYQHGFVKNKDIDKAKELFNSLIGCGNKHIESEAKKALSEIEEQ